MERPDDPEPPRPSEPDEGASPSEPPSSTGADAAPPAGDPDGFVLPEWLAFLHNRAILGGLSILVVLLLTAIILVAMGGGDSGFSRPLLSGITTPEGTLTPGPGGELVGRMRITGTLRNGPGATFAILGTIPVGTRVTVVGRNEDSTWLQVIPPSGIQGWVPIDFVDVAGDISKLVIGEAGRGPSVAIPTRVPGPALALTSTPVPPAAATATQALLPTAIPLPPTPTAPAPTETPLPPMTPPGPGSSSGHPPGLSD